jgi:DNA-binding NarL/FixJ family response regulator
MFVQCRNEGWAHEYGVFGGLSPEDRRSINQRRVTRVTQRAAADAERIDRELSRNAMVRLLDAGISVAEIAQRVGKPPNTVKSYIHRAKKRPLVHK